MRMWLVDPRSMCRQHLLGEHVELHMAVGSLQRGRSLAGFTAAGLLDLTQIESRHAALTAEMQRRGYRHASPIHEKSLRALIDGHPAGQVHPVANLIELHRRCGACREIGAAYAVDSGASQHVQTRRVA